MNLSEKIKQCQVLVVDDQFSIRRMINNFLRLNGFKRLWDAPDGRDALNILHRESLDLVISDWSMPRLGGLELLAAMRSDSELAHIPFLMVTAEAAEETVAQAIESEVDGYLLKPFNARRLVARVEELLTRQLEPGPVDRALSQGRQLLKQDRLWEAIDIYQGVLAATPGSPRTLLALGKAQDLAGRPEEALSAYGRAVELAPLFIWGHEALAELLERMGQKDRAAGHIIAASRISPLNAERHLRLGRLLLACGRNEEAVLAAERAVEVAADSAQVQCQAGDLLLAAGYPEEAARAFTASLARDPEQTQVYNRLGIAYRRQGDYQRALEQYEKALALAPRDEGLHYNQALALAAAGRGELARQALRRALSLRPDFSQARELLSRLAPASNRGES